MLINNVNGEPVGASMVRDSSFYIELAKFVQAYTIIIKNPNDFLAEVGEPAIDEKEGRVSWSQFVKIMQHCDFGYLAKPTDMELKVYYNYALQIGSLDSLNQKIATVNEVAEAQKHYYNFVDKAKDRAESEYLKQHKVYLSRENEMRNADNELSKLKAGSIFAFIMMVFSAAIGVFGVASLFLENIVATTIGGFIPVWQPRYIGAIIMILVGLLLFYLFDKMHTYFHKKHFKLERATETIFARGNESYSQEIYLKRKLDELTRELKTVQAELNDKHKRFDVKENINKLKATNKYYQKFAENEEVMTSEADALATDDEKNMRVEDFAPVKLSKEQEENLRRVSKEAITLEGQYDLEAYKEKFEKSRSEKEEAKEETASSDNAFDLDESKQEELKQKQAEYQEKQNQEQLKQQEKELIESIDYIKEILGFSGGDDLQKGN